MNMYIPDNKMNLDVMRCAVRYIEKNYVGGGIKNPQTMTPHVEAEVLRKKACKIIRGGDGWVDFGLDVFLESIRLSQHAFYQAFRAAAGTEIIRVRNRYESVRETNIAAPLTRKKIIEAQDEYKQAIGASSLSKSIYFYFRALHLAHHAGTHLLDFPTNKHLEKNPTFQKN